MERLVGPGPENNETEPVINPVERYVEIVGGVPGVKLVASQDTSQDVRIFTLIDSPKEEEDSARMQVFDAEDEIGDPDKPEFRLINVAYSKDPHSIFEQFIQPGIKVLLDRRNPEPTAD